MSSIDRRFLSGVVVGCVVLIGAAFLYVCGSSGSVEGSARAGSPGQRSRCEADFGGLPCYEVESDGRKVRYTRLDGQEESKGGELVDLGGPGVALSSTGQALAAIRKASPRELAVISVEEPWASATVSDGCRSSLSAFYVGVVTPSRSMARAADDLIRECGLFGESNDREYRWGWTPPAYSSALDAIASAEQIEFKGVVAVSFGAVRTLPAWTKPSNSWTILGSPAPFGLTGAQYLDGRSAGADAVFDRKCAGCSPKRDRRRAFFDLRQRLAAQPVKVTGRTPPVRAADADAAVYGTAYLTTEQQATFLRQLESPGKAKFEMIGALSDRILSRFGTLDMAPSFLAYLEEVCPLYAPWAAVRDRVDLMGRLHAPCGQAKLAAQHDRAPKQGSGRLCVANAPADGVVPASVRRDWARSFSDLVEIEAGRVHGDVAAVVGCFEQVPLAKDSSSRP